MRGVWKHKGGVGLPTPCRFTANRTKWFSAPRHNVFGWDCGFAIINSAGRALICFPVIKVPARVTHTHSVCEEPPRMTHQFVDSDIESVVETHLTGLEFNGEKEFHPVNACGGHRPLSKNDNKRKEDINKRDTNCFLLRWLPRKCFSPISLKAAILTPRLRWYTRCHQSPTVKLMLDAASKREISKAKMREKYILFYIIPILLLLLIIIMCFIIVYNEIVK